MIHLLTFQCSISHIQKMLATRGYCDFRTTSAGSHGKFPSDMAICVWFIIPPLLSCYYNSGIRARILHS
nr:hypothetical transcript [Hymenolepis microstoma]